MIRLVATRSSRMHLSIPPSRSTKRRIVRSFFASSTDFTRLLQEAELHKLVQENGSTLYVLAAGGETSETVRNVPQLHLARLQRQNLILSAAKVVNRTLGAPVDVCGRLVEAGKEDGATQALSTLHGLSMWVEENMDSIDGPADLSDIELDAVKQIARGRPVVNFGVYEQGRDSWEQLTRAYINCQIDEEAALYIAQGGILSSIEHQADTTDYASTCGGAMALFSFA